MAKAASLEEALAKVAALRGRPADAELRQELAKALASKWNAVAAKAGTLAGDLRLEDLADDLIAAFDRFITNPGADKGCLAKTAIATALYEMGIKAEDVFLRGVRHIQKEPTWGGSTDTAGELRGTCALGLVRMGYKDVLSELVDLLMDAEVQARIVAARAIAYADQPAGKLLLRLKILAGDREADVTGECFTALATLAPREAIPFLARYLDHADDTLRQYAALAISGTKQKEAMDLLLARWEKHINPADRRELLLPIAMIRSPEALEFLMSVIRTEHSQTAATAIEAMRMYRHDEGIKSKIKAIVEARKEPSVNGAFAKAFER